MSWPNGLPAPPEVKVVKLATDPGVLAVSMEEMRLALRADSSDEDLTIQREIEAAQDFFEIRCAWRLTPASYRADVVGPLCFPITIPRGPVRAVTAVEYWDCQADEWVAITGDHYRVEDNGCEFTLYRKGDSVLDLPGPLSFGAPGLRVYFEAGFDGAENAETSANGEAESGMIQCLKTLVSLMFQKREEATDSEKDMIVRRYRKFW